MEAAKIHGSVIGNTISPDSSAAYGTPPTDLESPIRLSKRPSSREAILDAAETVAAEAGAAHLTLDAVAERAKVSKGGLLYNFPTKEALLEAMLDRHMQRFEAKQRKTFDDLADRAGRELRALILAKTGPCPERDKHSGCATLAVVANNPRLLEPIRAMHRRRLERLHAESVAAGFSSDRSAVISLAVDGLALLELLQVSPYSAEERQRIIEDLLRLVDETTVAVAELPASPDQL